MWLTEVTKDRKQNQSRTGIDLVYVIFKCTSVFNIYSYTF